MKVEAGEGLDLWSTEQRERADDTAAHPQPVHVAGRVRPAGEGQALDAPFGHRLHVCVIATRLGAPILGRAGGTVGVDDAFAQQHEPGMLAVAPGRVGVVFCGYVSW